VVVEFALEGTARGCEGPTRVGGARVIERELARPREAEGVTRSAPAALRVWVLCIDGRRARSRPSCAPRSSRLRSTPGFPNHAGWNFPLLRPFYLQADSSSTAGWYPDRQHCACFDRRRGRVGAATIRTNKVLLRRRARSIARRSAALYKLPHLDVHTAHDSTPTPRSVARGLHERGARRQPRSTSVPHPTRTLRPRLHLQARLPRRLARPPDRLFLAAPLRAPLK
jgi:hypothetical protein